ncbi:MAG: amidophosphoribosyltransferase [Arenicellales bacterium]
MCGIVGLLDTQPVNQSIYDALTVIQHRGQDAAGMMTSSGNKVYLRKDNGLVRDVFHTRHMMQLKGNMGIGHVRYPTAGSDSRAEAQPFYVNSPFGIAVAHNGNTVNADQLRDELFKQDLRHLNTESDSEIILNIFAHELRESLAHKSLSASPKNVFEAVSGVFKRCSGGYAIVAMIVDNGILAFRDPHGIRPLAYGVKASDSGTGQAHMFSSESIAFDVLNFDLIGDVKPGEAVYVETDGTVHRKICAEKTYANPCIFEYVYLARPDSIIDGIEVYQTRLRMGDKLGAKLLKVWPDHDIDVVIPVPDTSRPAAQQLAKHLKVEYREGFIKNRYIGRTFIMPGQQERQKSVRQKLNAMPSEFEGKNVLLVDDSIVRGTTSRKIIELAREAGAKKVYFASAAPPVRHPNVYGIDMPTSKEFVAFDKSIQEIGEEIGADWILFQDIDDLIDAVSHGQDNITQFDDSCFTGEYITHDVSQNYLKFIEAQRSDQAKIDKNDFDLDLSEVCDVQEKQA